MVEAYRFRKPLISHCCLFSSIATYLLLLASPLITQPKKNQPPSWETCSEETRLLNPQTQKDFYPECSMLTLLFNPPVSPSFMSSPRGYKAHNCKSLFLARNKWPATPVFPLSANQVVFHLLNFSSITISNFFFFHFRAISVFTSALCWWFLVSFLMCCTIHQIRVSEPRSVWSRAVKQCSVIGIHLFPNPPVTHCSYTCI